MTALRSDSSAFLSILVAGVVCGLLAIVLSISLGSLLFTGELRAFIPSAIGLALFSTAVMAAVSAFGSAIPGIVTIAEEVPVVALTLVVGATAAAMAPSLGREASFATLVVAIGIATLATGAVTFALGYFRFAGVIRFMPYPVIGGFLAGTGWLIVVGGISLSVGRDLDWAMIEQIGDGSTLLQLGLTGALVAVLILTERLIRSPFAVPAAIVAILAAFNLGAFALGYSYADLRAAGWLIQLPETGDLWPPFGIADLAGVDWQAVARGMVNLPIVIVISIVALLMNTTGVELHARRDIDLNREMRVYGAMVALSGLGGGIPGYPAVSLTVLAEQLGARSRWVGVLVSALVLTALLLGSFILNAVPALLLGGILVWIGWALMFEWLVRARSRLPLVEYGVVLLIFLVVAIVSFPVGILVGLIAAVVLFAYEYSRVEIVRHEWTGAEFHGRAGGGQRAERLRQHGGSILIVRLQGFLFFGTADRLRKRFEDRMASLGDSAPRFLLLDFRRVPGMDSSALMSFVRLAQTAATHGFSLVLANVSERLHKALLQGGIVTGEDGVVRIEPDLERGLRWCEDQLLSRLDGAPTETEHRLESVLASTLGERALLVAPYCRRIELEPGSRLIVEGTASEDVFFIESGAAVVEMAGDLGDSVALATVGPGDIVGEISFYLGGPRTASVTVSEGMVAWQFSRADLDRLGVERPDVAIAFHQAMAAMLSRRLGATNGLVRFLAD